MLDTLKQALRKKVWQVFFALQTAGTVLSGFGFLAHKSILGLPGALLLLPGIVPASFAAQYFEFRFQEYVLSTMMFVTAIVINFVVWLFGLWTVRLLQPRPWFETIFSGFVALACFVLLLLMFMPTIHGPHHRQGANQSVAIGRLRTINTLQIAYASDKSSHGSFTCNLQDLAAVRTERDPYDDDFFSTQNWSGYRFLISDCMPDSDGVVRRYRTTAVPTVPGQSGFYAFCSNETNAIWYDRKGSAENCVRNRKPIE